MHVMILSLTNASNWLGHYNYIICTPLPPQPGGIVACASCRARLGIGYSGSMHSLQPFLVWPYVVSHLLVWLWCTSWKQMYMGQFHPMVVTVVMPALQHSWWVLGVLAPWFWTSALTCYKHGKVGKAYELAIVLTMLVLIQAEGRTEWHLGPNSFRKA